jgi:FAD/FMN-containing dehydrogenase
LGGGVGHLTRKYGLTIDNLLGADMVLADGRFVSVSAEENKDLFWAIRGGGGNFGVITSFLFKAHDVHTDYAGPTLYETDEAIEVMQWYRDFITSATEDINGFFAFLVVPPVPPFPEHLHNRTMCGVVWCYSGPPQNAEAVFKPIRAFKKAAFDHVGHIPHPVLNSLFDPLYPSGLQWYWRADFINELRDEAIPLHVKHGSSLPTMKSTTHFYPINGAAHRIGNNDTPWAYRDSNWAHVIVGVDPSPSNSKRITQWTKSYWNELHPYSAGGAYVNFMMEEGQDRVKATYGSNYERLVKVKNKYDPNNLFRVNQNIKPSVKSSAVVEASPIMS